MKVELPALVIVVSFVFCGLNLLVSKASIPSVRIESSSKSDGTFDEQENSRRNRSATKLQQNQHKPDRVYWRYDQAGLQDVVLSRSHWLPSIPPTRKIPVAQAENFTYHLLQRTNLTGERSLKLIPHTKGRYRTVNPAYDLEKDFRTLYLYNPSVVPLPYNDSATALLGIRESFGDDQIAYVATFRLYLGSNCFGPNPERLLMKSSEQISYLGIALLNKSLDILYDVVIDVNAGPLPKGKNIQYWNAVRQPAEDCRIFHVGTSLSLICNAIRFKIQLRASSATAPYQPQSTVNDTAAPSVFPHVYPNMYGNTIQVTLLEQPLLLIQNKEAKNMNVFYHETPQLVRTYYLQVYPYLHWYKPLEEVTTNAIMAPDRILSASLSFDTPDLHHTIRASLKDLGRGSNETIADQPFLPNDHDRGTACCVLVQYRGNVVRVGISHIKMQRVKNYWSKDQLHRYDNATYSWGWNRYLSRFLAYELEPPFAVIARSGWFCLGFGDVDVDNPLAGRNSQYKLDLFDDAYDCPAIHFPSGIAETVDDPTKAIISYGVNDCYPRMIVVRKKDIERRLDPSMDTK